jgi:hypothetical protein
MKRCAVILDAIHAPDLVGFAGSERKSFTGESLAGPFARTLKVATPVSQRPSHRVD